MIGTDWMCKGDGKGEWGRGGVGSDWWLGKGWWGIQLGYDVWGKKEGTERGLGKGREEKRSVRRRKGVCMLKD